MAFKILVSKPTKNVLTASSPDDFYLHSDYPLLKVHSYGTFSFVVNGIKTINHNLGYKPYVLVFSQLADYDFDLDEPIRRDDYYQHDWLQEGAAHIWWGWTKIYDNKIVISVGQSDTLDGYWINGFYYIFKDEV